MDKFVSMELQGKVTNEHRSAAAQAANTLGRDLGFFLDLLFSSFREDFAGVTPKSLIVPLSSIPHVARQYISYDKALSGSESDPIELYDKINKHWWWNLPLTQSTATTLAPSATSSTLSDLESHCSSGSLPKSPISGNDSEKSLTSEQQVTLFLNIVVEGFTASRARSTGEGLAQGHRCQWLARWSKVPLEGSMGYSRKPDLVLVDNDALSQDEITWLSPKVYAEYTKETFQLASQIGKTMDTKAYLVLVDQPWRHFVLGLSITNNELQVHFYDHSGGQISPTFNIHADTPQFLFIIAAFSFSCRTSIRFDPSIEIYPLPLSKRRRFACDISLIVEKTKDSGPNRDSPNDDHNPIKPYCQPFPIFTLETLLHVFSPHPADSAAASPQSTGPQAPEPTLFPISPNSKPLLVIRKIWIGDVCYDIIDILFSSTGFVGWGTVVYLAQLDSVYYVIKDHWVRVPDQGAADPMLVHEAKMMDLVKDINGVPKLHQAWIVEIEEEVPDHTTRYHEERFRARLESPRTHVCFTMYPCARPLTMFKSKKELVQSIRGILGSA